MSAAGRVAGVKVAADMAKRVDQLLCVEFVKHDGDPVAPGDTVLRITGPHCSVLTAERTMLNVLTHLSGIATLTGQFVDAVAGTAAKIYDTRKTIPGYRALAKYAVRCGGGFNHRMGLHDAVLIKDNHLAGMPGDNLPARLHAAIAAIHRQPTPPAFIELEVDTLDQLDAALTVPGIDIVLLDNMPPDQLRAAVARRDQRQLNLILEASGGIDLTTVRAIAETGIDRIAIGAITHSAPTLDLGLDET